MVGSINSDPTAALARDLPAALESSHDLRTTLEPRKPQSMLQTCLALVAAALLLTGTSAIAADLVVYTSRDLAQVTSILERFEAENHLDIDLVHADSKTLSERIIAEGQTSGADVIWLAEAGWFGQLGRKSVLAPAPEQLRHLTAPRMRDSSGKWVATSGHLRVLAYNSEMIAGEKLPKQFSTLAAPRYEGKLGWNPRQAGFLAHLSALRRVWGDEKTRQWLQALAVNEPVVFEDDRTLVEAIERGEVLMGFVAHTAVATTISPDTKTRIHTIPTELDAGNMLMLSGAAIHANAKHAEAAEKFIAFVLSESVQREFVDKGFEYPAREGMAAHDNLPTLDEVRPFAIEQNWLVDTQPTLELLVNAGIR
ncbi:MAG: iron(III) transport system substrate-binding protein [Hyphomicrobiaceae bacterium]